MADVRWKQEREEVIDLVYRVQADHGGNLSERDARRFGPWAPDAIKRAKKTRWFVAKGFPPILSVTNKGSTALDAALASRNVAIPHPHSFGESIVSVPSSTGPVLPPASTRPYEELQKRALEEGILTKGNIDRIARSPRRKSARRHGGLAWIGLHEPTEEEFSSVAGEFGLHPLAVEDAVKAHQRPKLERYDGTLFVVLRPSRYIDKTETVEFGEVHVFVGKTSS